MSLYPFVLAIFSWFLHVNSLRQLAPTLLQSCSNYGFMLLLAPIYNFFFRFFKKNNKINNNNKYQKLEQVKHETIIGARLEQGWSKLAQGHHKLSSIRRL
jgi:hypothetical protein